ncbi:DNA damage-induced apoptosis suppressor protein [Collichthys lucidus]|uniref:DNA damage-induced apoptosis suppressor protein n=1 Tax=Collichthys lucidus TaxID=240159 RepID=A0A4U5U7S9_COLLU|nr:DNA damage-induced apoptosis suppressor protein [Collichthys lucidus]
MSNVGFDKPPLASKTWIALRRLDKNDDRVVALREVSILPAAEVNMVIQVSVLVSVTHLFMLRFLYKKMQVSRSMFNSRTRPDTDVQSVATSVRGGSWSTGIVLSMRVSRDASIFGVTVFGTCLNSFFGIHASGLQRLVETPDGPVAASTKATLLRKAVEDCFVGRRFIFGLKVTKTDSGPLFGGPVANGPSSKHAVHFIASQMILPKAAGLEGCTVVSYYRSLLQKAADFELGSTDPSKTSRPPAADLLLIPCNSPGRSFNNISLCAAGFLSRSLQRSQYQDCTLTPTPPWQQSLGLVTSSAEQEEGCSTQDSGDENNTQTDNFRTPRHAQKGRLEDHKVTEETVLSPLLSLECRSYSNPSFSRYPHSPMEKAVRNTPIPNTCFSPSPPGHNISRRFSPRQLTETFLPSSLAWDDLPFSESLTEFLCEENRNFDIVSEIEPRLNVQNQKETTRNNLKMRSQDEDLSTESTSDCQSNTQIKHGESQILLDITNTPALNDRQDLSEQPCKNPAECKNKSQDRYLCSFKCHQENNKAIDLPFENEEEQLEEDTYNCSADLFGSSFMIDMNPNTPNMHAEATRMTTGACPVLSKPDRCHLRSEKTYDPNSTPDKQKQKRKSDSETVGDKSLDRSNCCFNDDENEACDWSRDLFSDSVAPPVQRAGSHAASLLAHLNLQRQQAQFCDCVVKHRQNPGQLYPAHRCVLAASSPVLASILSSTGALMELQAPCLSGTVLALLLDYIYTGALPRSQQQYYRLLSAASYLQMDELQESLRTENEMNTKHLMEESVPPYKDASSFTRGLKNKTDFIFDDLPPKDERLDCSDCSNVSIATVADQSSGEEVVGTFASSGLSALRQHFAATDQVVLLDISTKPAELLCSLCVRSFSQRGSLNRHVRSHLGVRPFSCPRCPMTFSRQYRVSEHMRVHQRCVLGNDFKKNLPPQCEKLRPQK